MVTIVKFGVYMCTYWPMYAYVYTEPCIRWFNIYAAIPMNEAVHF